MPTIKTCHRSVFHPLIPNVETAGSKVVTLGEWEVATDHTYRAVIKTGHLILACRAKGFQARKIEPSKHVTLHGFFVLFRMNADNIPLSRMLKPLESKLVT